jgi:hypothetical protein
MIQPSETTGAADSITSAIDSVIECLETTDQQFRQCERFPFPRPVQVTKDNKVDMCAGKDISHGGIGFVHTKPLYGVVIVGLTTPTGEIYRFLAEVVRARQVGRLYEIGAKFVERLV